MSSKQFKHVQRIQQKYNVDSEMKIDLNNAIRLLAEDLYKTDTHFIFELIQNAEDNEYKDPLPYISFWLTRRDPTCTVGSDGALIIENNEVGFNRDDVRAICAVGRTTKKKEKGYIGEKGIGFKSVFRVTGNPHIFSNGYHFCLPESDDETGLGYIVPRWIDILPEGIGASATYIILPLTKPDFGYNKIEKMLRDVQPEVILFLSKLQEIQIKTDTGIDFKIVKDDERLPEVIIYVENNTSKEHSYDFLVCTKIFDKPANVDHEKREGVEKRKVSIAFPLDKDSTATGKVFAYLPVEVATGLPFVINSDFILTSSRETIQEVPWNRWLMKCVATVIVEELLPLLKEQELLKSDLLEALAGELHNISTDENSLFYPIFDRLSKAFLTESFLPTNEDNTYVSAQSGALAGSAGLIDLLGPDQLSLLFQTQWAMSWIAVYINARRTPNLWRFLKSELGVVEVDPEMFASKLSLSFLVNQCDSWFIKFYKFLSIGARPPMSIWKPLKSPLRSKPILRLQDNSLVNPDESNVYLSMEADSTISSQLIKVGIVQDEDARRFLNDLGVQEWDAVEEVLQQILPKYQSNPPKVSGDQYARDISKIRVAYTTDSEVKKKRLHQQLMATLFIRVENPRTNEIVYLSPDSLAFGTNGLWRNFSGRYSQVSVQKEIRGFLKTLGIPEWDIVKETIDTILPKYRGDSVCISVDEYRNDLTKVEQAFSTDSKEKQTQLRNKLYAIPFVRVKPLNESKAVYLRPDQICFGTDGVWGNFSGGYIQVSTCEGTRRFLEKLDVSKWDITEEVIRTVLPKYSKISSRVPIDEHKTDFTKIQKAFNIDSTEKRKQFRIELDKVYFILVESSGLGSVIYRRPNQVYFSTDELRMYFDGNDSCKFISSKYDKGTTDLFKALGITDSVRVERRRKNRRGHVVISSNSGYRQRGCDGFDPDIQVDGLKYAIDNISPEKSEFIWNEITIPNLDCIQGIVERTETTYDDAVRNRQISSQFGELLIKTPWLPDSEGNMHKPSEITLAELPEEFIRDERLAHQLRMKKDEVAELAEKSGVPIEAIRELMENPEEYEEFKEWRAEKTRQKQFLPPESQGPKMPLRQIDYLTEIEKSFNKFGETEVKTQIIDNGKVSNPERRREKIAEEHHNRLNRESSTDDRRRKTYRTILEGPDPQVREYLSQMYGGKCQICDHTFPERDGQPFFVASYIVERQKARAVDTEANALCLCADHFAKFKHGAIEGKDISIQIEDFQTEAEGGNCKPILDIKLCGEKCEIRFKEKHLLDLQELLKVSNKD